LSFTNIYCQRIQSAGGKEININTILSLLMQLILTMVFTLLWFWHSSKGMGC